MRNSTFDEIQLKLNTKVRFTDFYNKVFKLEESRDWFICRVKNVNGEIVHYIIHHSEEETRDVFYYSFRYYDEDGNEINTELVRCAPMGISAEDAVHNNFTTKINLWPSTFTMFKV